MKVTSKVWLKAFMSNKLIIHSIKVLIWYLIKASFILFKVTAVPLRFNH